MISNGYKVIGIEENGDVEYDVMSSCPVSRNLQCHFDCREKNLYNCKSIGMNFLFFSHSKVSPSKPKFDGSTQKTISKEIQEAIEQYLLSNHHPSFTVSAQVF